MFEKLRAWLQKVHKPSVSDAPQQFFNKYKSVLSDEQFERIEDASLGLIPLATFTDEEIEKLEKELKERNAFNNKLSNCADRNNKGIAFEKDGNIEEAIKVFEANINEGYPATHSFDRLVILYRKKKMYSDELRVIDRALEIFPKSQNKWILRKEK